MRAFLRSVKMMLHLHLMHFWISSYIAFSISILRPALFFHLRYCTAMKGYVKETFFVLLICQQLMKIL